MARAIHINLLGAIAGGLCFVFTMILGNPGRAEALVADLSDHLIAVTTDFTGTELLLFGSIEEEGEVIVVVYGPRQPVTVRRKDRIAGIWINTASEIFGGVPAFYHVAMTEDATEGLPLSVLQRHQIGPDNLKFDAPDTMSEAERRDFRAALIRNKQATNLYSDEPGLIEMRGQRLFRATVVFPVNVPIGTYVIETLLVRDGRIESAQTTPLFISKIGAGAEIYRMAHTYPGPHGLIAILIAVVAGFGANWIFRRL